MMKAAAVKLKAKVGTGEKRQKKKAARVGGSYTVAAKPRSPEAPAELLVEPEAARTRRQRHGGKDESSHAQHVRRLASLVRTKQQVMELIKADAERRDPQHRNPWVVVLDGALWLWRLATRLLKEWRRVPCVLDILPVVGYLWSAANALFREGSKDGQRWVQQKLTAILRGRGGYVSGGLRQILTKRQLRKSVRDLTLRALKKSHDNDLRDYWRFRARQMRVRLYGRKPKYQPTTRLERIVVDPMPSRIVGNDPDQPGGNLRVPQRRIEDRAMEPDVPRGLYPSFSVPQTDRLLECRILWVRSPSTEPRIHRHQGVGRRWICQGKIDGNAAAHGQAQYVPNHHSDASSYRAVKQGVRAQHWNFSNMPALPHVTDAEVTQITAYVRRLQQQAGVR
jgi:hypothetical protein